MVDKTPDNAARINVSSDAFFSLRSEKKTFSLKLSDVAVKKQIKMWFLVLCTLINDDTHHHSGQITCLVVDKSTDQ